MRKLAICLIVGMFLAGLAACGGGGKYAEVRDTTEDMIDVMNSFGDTMAGAKDGATVADAVSDFVDEYGGLKEKIEALEKKFPEFDLKRSLPEELKDLKPKLEEAMMKMFGAMMQIEKFKRDPAVAKVKDKLRQLKKLGRGM